MIINWNHETIKCRCASYISLNRGGSYSRKSTRSSRFRVSRVERRTHSAAFPPLNLNTREMLLYFPTVYHPGRRGAWAFFVRRTSTPSDRLLLKLRSMVLERPVHILYFRSVVNLLDAEEAYTEITIPPSVAHAYVISASFVRSISRRTVYTRRLRGEVLQR